MVRNVMFGVLVVCGGCAMGAYAPRGAAEVEARPGYEPERTGFTDDGSVRQMAPSAQYSYDDDYVLTSEAESPSGGRASREEAFGAGAMPEIAPSPALPRYAQATPAGTTTPPVVADVRSPPSSMLIYTAAFLMAVLDVDQKQTQLIARAREMGGFLAEQSTTLVRIRIPAARFEDYLDVVAQLGDVLDRRITVSDVGEEYRDVAIRIQNLEAVRHRFEQMLTQANNVETALAIQRELERVTTELELLKGRQRYLADQVALSTVTVNFRPLASVAPDTRVRLPFPWLTQLGLRNLLTLDGR